jgi:hypothetical protein
MGATINNPIEEAKLIELLRQRYHSTDREECPELEKIALAMLGSMDEDVLAASREHLLHCPDCSEAVMLIHGLQARKFLKPLNALLPTISHERSSWFRRRAFYPLTIAVAAVIALVVLTVVLFYRPAGLERRTGMVIKGDSDEIYVAVKRGSQSFKARPLERLLDGDQIGLFYSAPKQGYLAILDLDEKGKVTILHPVGKVDSAMIDVGKEVPLPDGGVVQKGAGCEWLVAIFSNQALPLKEIEELVRNFPKDSVTCRVEVSVPGARTVRVFPFVR